MFKLVKPKETNGSIKPMKFWKKYWYIRDDQGNIMATYNKTMSLTENEYTYNENLEVLDWSIYGSERLGIIKEENVLLSQREFTMFGTPSNGSWFDRTYTGAASLTSVEQNTFYMVRGNKQYELSNHLGNVLVTVQDRKRSMDINSNDLADYYVPYLRTVTDYYAFGSSMPGIGGVVPKCTVTQTQTTQTVVDVNEDFNSGGTGGFTAGTGARTVSNPSGTKLHIESLWSTRPLANRTVSLVNGRSYTLDFDLDGFSVVSGYTHTVRVRILLPGSTQTFSYTTSGSKSLTFTSNTTGNVTIEISSLITGSGSYTMNPYIDIDNFELSWEDLVTISMNNCESLVNYRYGFNTQERTDEIYGEGNSFSAEFWQYDGRLGRRWNVDPVFKYYESPYVCLGNNPICVIDLNGADSVKLNGLWTGKWKTEKGNTLAGLALSFETSEETIKRLNPDVDFSNLSIGTVIKVVGETTINFVNEGAIAIKGQTNREPVNPLFTYKMFSNYQMLEQTGSITFIVDNLGMVINVKISANSVTSITVQTESSNSQGTTEDVTSFLSYFGFKLTPNLKFESKLGVVKDATSSYNTLKKLVQSSFKKAYSWAGEISKAAIKKLRKAADKSSGQSKIFLNMFANTVNSLFARGHMYDWSGDDPKKVILQGERFFVTGTNLYMIYLGISFDFE